MVIAKASTAIYMNLLKKNVIHANIIDFLLRGLTVSIKERINLKKKKRKYFLSDEKLRKFSKKNIQWDVNLVRF